MIYAKNPVKIDLVSVTDRFCYPEPITFSGTFVTENNIISVDTISLTGGLARVTTLTQHNRKTGDIVEIKGAVESGYNGKVKITVLDNDEFTYYADSTLSSPATGAIVVDLGGAKATGTDTKAGVEFVEGDFIYVASVGEVKQVDKIASETSWTFKEGFSTNLSDEVVKVVKNGIYSGVGFKNVGGANAVIDGTQYSTTAPEVAYFDLMGLQPICGDATGTELIIALQRNTVA
jgi:hypothetical protein